MVAAIEWKDKIRKQAVWVERLFKPGGSLDISIEPLEEQQGILRRNDIDAVSHHFYLTRHSTRYHQK